MAKTRKPGLHITRPLHDPTGELKAMYLLALNEGWFWWQDPLVIRPIVKDKQPAK